MCDNGVGRLAYQEKDVKSKEEENLCYCGCGEHRGSHAEFAPGHDGKLRSLLLQVQREEAKISDIPSIAVENRDKITFIQENTDFRKMMDEAAGGKTHKAAK